MGYRNTILNFVLFASLFFAADYALFKFLELGLRSFYGFDKKPEVLINGSSMSLADFNVSQIEQRLNKDVINYSKNGVSLEDRIAMVKHFYNEVKTDSNLIIIFEVNPMLFSEKFTAENVYLLFLPFMDDPNIEQMIKAKSGKREFLIYKMIKTSRFDKDLVNSAVKGYMDVNENPKNSIVDPQIAQKLLKDKNKLEIEVSSKKVSLFEKFLNESIKKNHHIILVNMPMIYEKKVTYREEDWNNYILYFNSLSAKNGSIDYIDLNEENIIKNRDLFSDPVHSNALGQKIFTDLLLNQLDSLM